MGEWKLTVCLFLKKVWLKDLRLTLWTTTCQCSWATHSSRCGGSCYWLFAVGGEGCLIAYQIPLLKSAAILVCCGLRFTAEKMFPQSYTAFKSAPALPLGSRWVIIYKESHGITAHVTALGLSLSPGSANLFGSFVRIGKGIPSGWMQPQRFMS